MAKYANFKIEGMPESLVDPRKFNNVTRNLFEKEMIKTMITVQQHIDKKTPVGESGKLRSNNKSHVDGFKAIIENNMKYAKTIEYGRKPGIGAPYDALEIWVKKSTKGRSIWATMKEKNKKITALQVAKFMAYNIKKKGIKAQHYFRDGVKSAWPTIEKNIKILHEQVAKEIMA